MPEGNLIYAYDDEAGKIIVINAETGEAVEQRDNRTWSILQHLHQKGNTRALRTFTLWCARQTNASIKPQQQHFFNLGEAAIANDITEEELHKCYQKTEGQAVATDSVGLQKGKPAAPAFLAARECVNPDALAGARNAARYHLLWEEMQQRQTPAGLNTIDPPSKPAVFEAVLQQQIDFLLECIAG